MMRHLLRRKLDFSLDFVGFTVSGVHVSENDIMSGFMKLSFVISVKRLDVNFSFQNDTFASYSNTEEFSGFDVVVEQQNKCKCSSRGSGKF